VQATLQQTPSAQEPLVQSVPATHFFPWPQAVWHVDPGAASPPQSMSVSVPSLMPSLQASMPPQPSGITPHVVCCSAHVVCVQPQTPTIPPPPHVSGGVHCALVVQPVHWPATHARFMPHGVPSEEVPCEGTPAVHTPGWQPPPCAGGRSVSAATDVVPPLPLHSMLWQSPVICGGLVLVGVPDAV
jgi:hypothetical protein